MAIIQLMPMYDENTKKAESLPFLCGMPINNNQCSATINDNSASPISLETIMKREV